MGQHGAIEALVNVRSLTHCRSNRRARRALPDTIQEYVIVRVISEGSAKCRTVSAIARMMV